MDHHQATSHGGAFSPSLISLLCLCAAACLCLCLCRWCYLLLIKKTKIKKKKKKKKSKPSSSSSSSPLRPPPPPGRGSGLWWSVLETLCFLAANGSGRGFYHFVEARHRRYGPAPCFRTPLFGRTHVFVSASAPDAAALLLLLDSSLANKRYVRTVADLLGEHSLLCAPSHERHRSLRRAVAPLFFNARTNASLAATFDDLTRRTFVTSSSSSSSSKIVVLDVALGITFEAVCGMLVSTLLHDDSKEGRLRQMQSDVLAVTQAMLAFPLRMPGTRFHAGLQARKRIMDVLRQEIATRRENNNSNNADDFLQSLLRRRQQHQQSSSSSSSAADDLLSDEQILDNILTLIIAGQVTTATAITWMVKYLADNRDVQEKLRSIQLELLLAPEHQDSPLTLEQLNGMDYAYKVVKESLRMATIVSWFPRVALQDCQVAGFHISKGWTVNVDARSLHYDPTIYANPTAFDPSRFNEDTAKGSSCFLAFGAGARTCLGMNMAKTMMLVFLHRLVTSFRWEMADHDPSLEKWAMFPRLRSGCPVRLTTISSSSRPINQLDSESATRSELRSVCN